MFTSHSGRFTPQEEANSTHWMWWWLGLGTSQKALEKEHFYFLLKFESPFLGHPLRILEPNTDWNLYLLYINKITKFIYIHCAILQVTAE